jgi:hypothetical protein
MFHSFSESRENVVSDPDRQKKITGPLNFNKGA